MQRLIPVYQSLARSIVSNIFMYHDFCFRDKHEENHKPALHKVRNTLNQNN